MSLSSRRELLAVAAKRYGNASACERRPILDEFVSSTGYDRNYAIRLLCHPPALPSAKRGRRPRSKTYGPQTQASLEKIWKIAGGICGKRLVPILSGMIDALERHKEIDLSADVRKRLLSMSPATCDRLLGDARAEHPARGLCTTKPTPHLLLRSRIPVRTSADWNDSEPGFLEIDLVAHCGETARGDHLFTLTAVDVSTGWTLCLPLRNKGQIGVTDSLDTLRRKMPYPLLGIDTDNGGEFINHHLVRYCKANGIAMTRCRPYKKNDQCHVEQKNGNVVRAMAGYARYEGKEPFAALAKLYILLADYQNFFQPSMKLVAKSRDGAKVAKTYDKARTPCQRILDSEKLDEDVKQPLRERRDKLNPAALHRSILRLRQELRKLAVDYDPAVDTLGEIEGIGSE